MPAITYNFIQKEEKNIYIYIYIFKVFLHALGQIIRITIENRLLKGFTKYSKGIRINYTYGQGVPEPRASEF